jgi:translation initiation factor eIF-2B subunit beta
VLRLQRRYVPLPCLPTLLALNLPTRLNREISSSRHAALETAQLLYRFVGAAKFASIEQLIGMIKEMGMRLVAANPKGEFVVCEYESKVLLLYRD